MPERSPRGPATFRERDLLGNPIVPEGPAMTPAERRKLLRPKERAKGYAAEPGTGPEGETCGSCAHHATVSYSKIYHKCGLLRQVWTGGRATDILVRSPACRLWEHG